MQLLVVVLLLASTSAHADLPKRPSGISARANDALVLEEDSPRLVAIDATGTRDVAHPDVGNLDAIEGRWILGRTGLLHEVDARGNASSFRRPARR